jgi:hypothetical protein
MSASSPKRTFLFDLFEGGFAPPANPFGRDRNWAKNFFKKRGTIFRPVN